MTNMEMGIVTVSLLALLGFGYAIILRMRATRVVVVLKVMWEEFKVFTLSLAISLIVFAILAGLTWVIGAIINFLWSFF